MKRITIIGGGASGTLLAINLLQYSSDGSLEINLVEKRASIGRGVAFSTEQDAHLLNVPAAKMGAFPDNVEHFHAWLVENGYSYQPFSFVPRRIFGQYLRENLEKAYEERNPNVNLNIFDDEAVDIAFDESKAQVILRTGDVLYSERVVLAFGNFLPPHPTVEDLSFVNSERYFQDPWSSQLFEKVKTDDSVLVVGTGLSMVDVAIQLFKNGHRGKIQAISTRGLLPAVHRLGFTYPPFFDELRSYSRITDLLKSVRRHIQKAESDGSDWRAVIDCLRPVTQEIWLGLPIDEKKYFLQHLSRYWNVARHRMPAEAAEILDKMRSTGQLEILKGRLRTIDVNKADGFDITYRTDGVPNATTADIIVNCIGAETKFDRLDSSLVKNLFASGRLACDSLSQGLDAKPDGKIVGRNGEISDLLYTLGTALKGILWETTAIPEIRVQARDLAHRLIAN